MGSEMCIRDRTDTRVSLAPWTVAAAVGDFHDGAKTFSGKYLGWTPKLVNAGAGATAGAGVGSGFDNGSGLKTSRQLASAAQGHDRGTAGLGADLDLKFPNTVAKGSYRATMTITALAG